MTRPPSPSSQGRPQAPAVVVVLLLVVRAPSSILTPAPSFVSSSPRPPVPSCAASKMRKTAKCGRSCTSCYAGKWQAVGELQHLGRGQPRSLLTMHLKSRLTVCTADSNLHHSEHLLCLENNVENLNVQGQSAKRGLILHA